MTDASALAASAKTTLYARPSNYGVTHLYWSFISTGWDSITLVRNLDGYPTSITDGETLHVWTSDPAQAVTYLGVSSKYHFFDTGDSLTSSTANPGKGVTGDYLQGKTAYYALFMTYTVSSNQYVSRSAVETTLVVKDDGMLDTLMASIPSVYKSENDDLKDFLALFAFHLSLYKQQTTNVFDMHNPSTVDSKLLTALLKQFGASLYGDMSVAQGRVLLANLIDSYTKSGSIDGIKNFIELYTGYGSTIASTPVAGGGVNRLLDYNSSSFVESLGSWYPEINGGETAYASTAPYAPFISWVLTNENSVYPYGHSGSDTYQGPFKEKGFLKLNAVLGSTQDVTLRLGQKRTVTATSAATSATSIICKPLIAEVGDYVLSSAVPTGTYVEAVNTTTASLTLSQKLITNIASGAEVQFSSVALDRRSALEACIPISASTAYTFSAFFNRDSYTGKSVKLAIRWYDKTGTLLSTSSYGTTLNTASGSANTWQRATVTATSPSNSRYAVPIVTFLSCSNGDIMYMDAAQFEAGSSASAYQDARVVNITVHPNRVNQVLNPSFETNTNFWYMTDAVAPMVYPNPANSAITTRTTAAHVTGSYAGVVTLTTPSTISGTISKNIAGSTATITVSGGHGYTTGDYIVTSERYAKGSITVTSTTTFTIGGQPTNVPYSGSVKMYKAGTGSSNVRGIVPSFYELVPVSSASYDLNGDIVVNTAWPINVSSGQTITGGSTVANDVTNTEDISSTIQTVNSPTSFTVSSSGTNTSSLFDNNAYVFSTIVLDFFIGKNIYFNGDSTSGTTAGVVVNADEQYVFSVSAKIPSLPSGIGVAALPYILTNPGDASSNYRIDNAPTLKGVYCKNNVATFYTNTPHQFLAGDKVHIFGLPSTQYANVANTIAFSAFNTTNANTVYTITAVGNRYFTATRTTSMSDTDLSKAYFETTTLPYVMWDLSSSWTRMSVPGNSVGGTLGTNNYTRAIVGLYVAQSFDTSNTGGTYSIYIDNALFEKGASRKFYFDGHYDGHSLYDASDRDTKWAGTADASKSYYYKDFVTAQARLKDTLPDAILYGSGTIGVGPGWSALYSLTYSE